MFKNDLWHYLQNIVKLSKHVADVETIICIGYHSNVSNLTEALDCE